MTGLPRWPERCTLMGCASPRTAGHHHHYWRGHLETRVCQCPNIAEPGTRPVMK